MSICQYLSCQEQPVKQRSQALLCHQRFQVSQKAKRRHQQMLTAHVTALGKKRLAVLLQHLLVPAVLHIMKMGQMSKTSLGSLTQAPMSPHNLQSTVAKNMAMKIGQRQND